MRVIVNGVSAVAGGGLTYLASLVEWLPKTNPDDSFVFALAPNLRLSSPHPGIEFRSIGAAGRGIPSRLFWENTELPRFCEKEGGDILFCPANIAPLSHTGIPKVIMVQNVAPFYPRVRKLYYKYEGFKKAFHQMVLEFLTIASVKRSDHVLYLSHATRKLLEKKVGEIPCDVLYHGINSSFHPSAKRPQSAPNEPYFLYVSNIYVYKGLEYLIDALKRFPQLPPVVVAGKIFDEGYFHEMQRAASEAGIKDRLIFRGDVAYADLPGWYTHASALVYPSWCENCPNILLEAMACGCPVVAMKTGPMPEICGTSGWFADRFSGNSLGEKMIQAQKLGMESEIRDKARSRAGCFTWEASLRILMDSFKKAVEAGKVKTINN